MKNILDRPFDYFGRDMGLFCRCRFKGGGGSTPSSNISNTKTGEYARENLYPIFERGLAGKGLMPAQLNQRLQREDREGLSKSFKLAGEDMRSDMSRVLDSRDARSRGSMEQQLARSYDTAKDSLRRRDIQRDITDQDTARDMSFAAVSNEARMGASAMQSYNSATQQQIANEARYGTFGTNVAGGLGSAATSLYFANAMGS